MFSHPRNWPFFFKPTSKNRVNILQRNINLWRFYCTLLFSIGGKWAPLLLYHPPKIHQTEEREQERDMTEEKTMAASMPGKVAGDADSLPKSVVRRLVKQNLSQLSENSKISIFGEAIDALSETSRIFIHYLSAASVNFSLIFWIDVCFYRIYCLISCNFKILHIYMCV